MMPYMANVEAWCIAHEVVQAVYETIWLPTSVRCKLSNVPWSAVFANSAILDLRVDI